MRRSTPLLLALLVFTLAACSDDESSEPRYGDPLPDTAQTQQAETSASDSVAAARSLDEMTSVQADDQAMSRVGGLYGGLQLMVNAKQKATLGQSLAGLGTLAVAQQALDPGCMTADVQAHRVTYDNCSYGMGSITGSVSKTGDTVTVDLTIVVSTAAAGVGGADVTVRETGSVTVSEGLVSGALSLRYSVQTTGGGGAAAVSTDYVLDATYADIVVSEGCAVGGTLEVHAVVEVNAGGLSLGGGAGDLDLWVKADFGPQCGDVTLY